MGESLRGVAVGATGLVIGILAIASIPLVNWIIHKEVTKVITKTNFSCPNFLVAPPLERNVLFGHSGIRRVVGLYVC